MRGNPHKRHVKNDYIFRRGQRKNAIRKAVLIIMKRAGNGMLALKYLNVAFPRFAVFFFVDFY